MSLRIDLSPWQLQLLLVGFLALVALAALWSGSQPKGER